ncbi:HEPN domain-containing protein [Rhizobium leguminosarum]|uniref:HEPN domain-containing protein n=1 Tax=Rhizobium leguminosarum TaxID=384 RepID=UPI00098FA00A|nr:HEPN domain-containing protein [Rhizobium leguminosarum]MBB5255579.1 hypothetical protein [Rhizobium leguminosarum]MDX6000912.1 HEPN domain-containing protein [Rhizobium leguminosarum]OOO44398.1 hypothetical protein BS629_30205 [Rhizobium leguminosarum bv. viciae USDA 2370]PUB62870.1 hypothetical protein DB728_14045 [Rhizobium leguminosarum bv. viciae USDA 2370]
MDEAAVERVRSLYRAFEAAFDELHAAVLEKIENPDQYFSPHHDYPILSPVDSGFPIFHEHGFYSDNAPRNYVGVFRPLSILGALTHRHPKKEFPEGAKLISLLKGSEFGKRLQLDEPFSGHDVDRMVATAVERYLHVYGTGPLNPDNRRKVLRPIFMGVIRDDYPVTVMVPIALTHFAADRFPLSGNAYVARIPRGLQLARSRIDRRGSGAVAGVVSAATHAYVSTDWSLPASTIRGVRDGLNDPSQNVLEEIDVFFAALRAATGAITGYAQVCMVPRRWSVGYFVDLPPVFGATYRRYPNSFDNYGWAGVGQSVVTARELEDVRRLYNLILGRREERVAIALKRLNSCMTRDDAVDAILDATIGLEVLLGDQENQALSYKLRLRAGALARHSGTRKPSDVVASVKKIYEVRSAIVHGLKTKKPKKRLLEPQAEPYVAERAMAADMLRFVIDILLEHPVYLDPLKIDADLLIEPALPEGQGLR